MSIGMNLPQPSVSKWQLWSSLNLRKMAVKLVCACRLGFWLIFVPAFVIRLLIELQLGWSEIGLVYKNVRPTRRFSLLAFLP